MTRGLRPRRWDTPGIVFRIYPFANTIAPSSSCLLSLHPPPLSSTLHSPLSATFSPSTLIASSFYFPRAFVFSFLSPFSSPLFRPPLFLSFSISFFLFAIAFNHSGGWMHQILQRGLNRLHGCDILHDFLSVSRCNRWFLVPSSSIFFRLQASSIFSPL